ncbi:GNAT family N-acetyltransferase [Halopenitus salinus]|uniref:GNAT family N-acetyltransferase n=1 Tax=Halopenitus salinus TaxID=1198295 RepID=UPI0036D2C6FB
MRPVRKSDAAAVIRLQRHLDRPSPNLLGMGLNAAGGANVLVSTVPESGPSKRGGSTADSDAADRPSPVAGYLLHVDGGDNRHVAEVVVDPANRRTGRGRELIEAAITGSPGTLSVLVAVENDAARSLYESCGFEAAERRPNEYGERDALCYRFDPDA